MDARRARLASRAPRERELCRLLAAYTAVSQYFNLLPASQALGGAVSHTTVQKGSVEGGFQLTGSLVGSQNCQCMDHKVLINNIEPHNIP